MRRGDARDPCCGALGVQSALQPEEGVLARRVQRAAGRRDERGEASEDDERLETRGRLGPLAEVVESETGGCARAPVGSVLVVKRREGKGFGRTVERPDDVDVDRAEVRLLYARLFISRRHPRRAVRPASHRQLALSIDRVVEERARLKDARVGDDNVDLPITLDSVGLPS